MSIFIGKSALEIGKQDNSLVSSIERLFIALFVTVRCNNVELAVWEYGGTILRTGAVTVREKNTVGFIAPIRVMPFLRALSHTVL